MPATRFYPHDKKILMWRSGEKKIQQIQSIKNDFYHVFANYYWSETNVTSIPLGYNNFFQDNQIPVNERLYNTSFLGALNKNRIQMISELSGINKFLIAAGLFFDYQKTLKFLNHYIEWIKRNDKIFLTWEFNNGIGAKEYCNILRHTKIVLSPRGWVNTETFRLYEAMQYGCIVVTEKLPHRKYYSNIPVVQIDNWEQGFKQIKQILKDDKLLLKLSEEHKQFYKNNLSPEATANIIIKELVEKNK